MVESIYHLYLLDKMTDMPIAKTLLLEVFLHCNLLPQPSAQEYLTVATSTDRLDNLDLIFRDEKSELDALLFQVCRNFSCINIAIHCMLSLFFLSFSLFYLRLSYLSLPFELREEVELDKITPSLYWFSFICWIYFTKSMVRCFFANSAIGSFEH
jgi:hypothetical protein